MGSAGAGLDWLDHRQPGIRCFARWFRARAAGTALFVTVMASVAASRIAGGATGVAVIAAGVHTAFLCNAIISLFAIPVAFFIRRESESSRAWLRGAGERNVFPVISFSRGRLCLWPQPKVLHPTINGKRHTNRRPGMWARQVGDRCGYLLR